MWINELNKDNMLLRFFLFLVFMAMFSCGKQQPAQRQPGEKMKIVATTGMIGDAVEEIAGSHAEVVTLMGAGVDPHLYKATHGDLERLTAADVIFYNGLHLEGKMGEVFEKLARTKPVIAIGDELAEEKLRKVAGFQGAFDPHIWFDVKLWSEALGAVSRHLQAFDSAHARDYVQNHARYLEQLDSLDKAVRQTILQIPASQRVLITAHDAFGYFGDAYNIEVRGLQGISTLSEFGLRDVTELVDFIIARKVKAIFVETSVSQRSIEAVVEGCRQKGWNVVIGGRLYSDAMGERGTPEGTYVGMVNANVKAIAESLK